MAIKPLTLQDAEFIAHSAAVELMSFIDEPIPPFETRYPGRLESCLAQPFATFDGKYIHRTFHKRAAVLFYMIAKSQCFVNGNKRMAVMLTAVFFFVNNRWINVPPMQLYDLACAVGSSSDREKNEVIKTLDRAFREFEGPLPRTSQNA